MYVYQNLLQMKFIITVPTYVPHYKCTLTVFFNGTFWPYEIVCVFLFFSVTVTRLNVQGWKSRYVRNTHSKTGLISLSTF
jgi:hypothetical protein